MTLKEAKKILEKEGFVVERFLGVLVEDVKTASWEKIEVSEAMRVVAENGYLALMEESKYKERKARLKKEYEKNTKAPCSGEEQPKEKKGIIYPTTFPKADFYYKHVLNEGNPALEESASQFNDALLDEQAKKIEELTRENERLERVSKTTADEFNKLYYRMITKSDKIEALGKEIAKLNGIIHDKNAILSDVAEELRLTKIREKNLVEVSQKYMKENEELKKKLADKVVDKIDAQALNSAESALAYKEKVIAEKDEVIADLTHELKAKHKKYVWYKGAYDAAQQILNTIADYAAKHPDKKISDPMEVVKPNKLSPFKDDKSYGEVTNQKDISPNLKVTVRLYGKEIEDLFKEIKSLWQE